VVTAGGLGLAAGTGHAPALQLPAEPVAVISTHGAGDCFTGALAYDLACGAPLERACRAAAHAAALHVSTAHH